MTKRNKLKAKSFFIDLVKSVAFALAILIIVGLIKEPIFDVIKMALGSGFLYSIVKLAISSLV